MSTLTAQTKQQLVLKFDELSKFLIGLSSKCQEHMKLLKKKSTSPSALLAESMAYHDCIRIIKMRQHYLELLSPNTALTAAATPPQSVANPYYAAAPLSQAPMSNSYASGAAAFAQPPPTPQAYDPHVQPHNWNAWNQQQPQQQHHDEDESHDKRKRTSPKRKKNQHPRYEEIVSPYHRDDSQDHGYAYERDSRNTASYDRESRSYYDRNTYDRKYYNRDGTRRDINAPNDRYHDDRSASDEEDSRESSRRSTKYNRRARSDDDDHRDDDQDKNSRESRRRDHSDEKTSRHDRQARDAQDKHNESRSNRSREIRDDVNRETHDRKDSRSGHEFNKNHESSASSAAVVPSVAPEIQAQLDKLAPLVVPPTPNVDGRTAGMN